MLEKKIIVKIPTGLEARPVAMFVQVASQFECNVYVTVAEKKVNAKSIMGMMSLGVLEDEELIIQADGVDEEEALEKLSSYLVEGK